MTAAGKRHFRDPESDIRRSTNVTHEPLTRERHAAIVAELLRGYTRKARTAYRVLYMPTLYVFNDCDVCKTPEGKWPHAGCGLTLMHEMDALRLAFQKVTEWDAAMRILRDLIRKDDQANRMSIGVDLGGRILYGEAV